MSLRTKSRIPASTSVTAARLLSTSSVASISSERMVAFIGYSSVSHKRARTSPARRSGAVTSGLPILTASGPICGNAGSFLREEAAEVFYQLRLKPALMLLFAAPDGVSRARDGDAVEQFLFGADLA